MEMIITLLWFLAGAVSCQILRNLLYFNEQRNMFVNIVSAYIPLIRDLKAQVIIASSLKENSLRDAGLSEDDLD